FRPAPYCSLTSRGSSKPCCANTHCTKPLQSKPDGSLPPLRYGTPRSIIAVSTTREGVDGANGTPSGGGGAGDGTAGVDAGGAGAPGKGRGRGLPLEAHAAAERVIR